MSVALLVVLLPISSYIAALPYITVELGLNNFQAGALYSAYLVGYAGSAIYLVPLTDKFGPKRILYISAVISVVGHLAFPLFAEDLIVGLIFRGIAGVGFLGVYTPALRIIAERFSGRRRGSAMGLFVTAQYVSHSVSLVLTGLLLSALEWRDAYIWVALLSVISVPLLILLLKDHSTKLSDTSTGRLNLKVLADPRVRYLILGYSLHAAHVYAVRVWLPVFLTVILVAHEMGGGDAPVVAAATVGLALGFGAVGPFLGGVLSDKIGRPQAAIVILSIAGLCAFTIGWVGHWPWAVIVGITFIYAWAVCADSAIYQAGITEIADQSQLGSTMALQASIGLLGGVLGPIIFGTVLDVLSDDKKWVIGFAVCGIITVIAILGLQRLLRPETKCLIYRD